MEELLTIKVLPSFFFFAAVDFPPLMELLLKILQPFSRLEFPLDFLEEQWNEAAKWPQKLVGSKRLSDAFSFLFSD